MADLECRELEIQLEFVRWSSAELNNFSVGSSQSKKCAQVIRRQPHEFFLTQITCYKPTEMVMAQEKGASTWLWIIIYRRTWICPPQRGIQRCPSS